MPPNQSLEAALAEDAQKIQAKYDSPKNIEEQRIASINAALEALELSFSEHPEFIIPNPEAVKTYARTFEEYLDAQLIKKFLNWQITTHVDTKESQASHRRKGTKNVIVGHKPTLIYQVWVELKDKHIHVYWKILNLK